jgi:hypothetical protein
MFGNGEEINNCCNNCCNCVVVDINNFVEEEIDDFLILNYVKYESEAKKNLPSNHVDIL